MSKKTQILKPVFAVLTMGLLSAAPAWAHSQDKEAPKKDIDSVQLTDSLYLLTGPGGNIGVSIGPDGVIVIDDKFDRFGEAIIAEIKTLTDHDIAYVINTHYHGDHTGANAKMKAVGATIVAHDNVRSRMGTSFENTLWNRTIEATDPSQWPTVTYSEGLNFYLNGESVRVVHTPNAHTDGDSIIYFKQADIVHMGDNYFKGMFPYVDVDSGGTLQGMIAAQTGVIDNISAATQVIPGHGSMSNRAELIESRDRLQDILDRVKAAKESGQDEDAIIAANILGDYAELAGFIDEAGMVKIAYRSLSQE